MSEAMLDELAQEKIEDAVFDRLIARADLPPLLAALRQPARKPSEARVQERVCLVLEHLAAPEAIPALLRCLEETSKARVRRAVLRTLAAIPPRRSAAHLILQYLRDERDEATSRLAARVLGRLKNAPATVLDALELRVYDDRRSVRRAAGEALGRLKNPRESTLEALEDLAGCEWSIAVDALLKLDEDRAIPFLLDAPDKHRALWRMDRVPSLQPYLIERSQPGDGSSEQWGDLGELARFQLEASLRRELPRMRGEGLLAERDGDPLEWSDRIARLGVEAATRAGLAAARAVHFLWAEAYPDDLLPMDALFKTERWLIHRGELPSAGFGISQFCTPGSFAAGWAAKRALEIPAGGPLRDAVMWAIRARMGSTGIVPVGGEPEEERLTLRYADSAIRAAISRELAPWQAGAYDPIIDVTAQRKALTG